MYYQIINLQTEFDKQWTSTDLAGTYTGNVILTVNADPYGP